MGSFERLSANIDATANAVLDRFEEPAEVLGYEYERQIEKLRSLRLVRTDVESAGQQLLFEASRLEGDASSLEQRARDSVRRARD
jgi:phage shock protein A